MLACLIVLIAGHNATAQYAYNWNGTHKFFISAEFLKPFGIEDLVPFGYRLNSSSQIKVNTVERKQFSDVLPVTDTTVFSSVQYAFRDSMTTVATLAIRNFTGNRSKIESELNKHFGHADFKNANETVYSDEDFLVALNAKSKTMEVVSLDHQQLLEQIISNINLRNYKDDSRFWFNIDAARAVGLEFYNQVTKENNVQMAFRLYNNSPKALHIKQIVFQLDGAKKISFPVSTITDARMEKITRCFIQYDVARQILHAENVKVIVRGDAMLSYEMPAYQRHSLKSAIQFYKENVTNPLLQYKGW